MREAQEGGSYRGREGGTAAATLAYPRTTLHRGFRSNFLGFWVSYSDTKKLLVINFHLQIRGSGVLSICLFSNILNDVNIYAC